MLNPCKSSLAAVGFSLFICLFFFFVYPGSLGAVLAPTGTPTMSDFNLPEWPVLRMFSAGRSLAWERVALRPCEVALVLKGRLQE